MIINFETYWLDNLPHLSGNPTLFPEKFLKCLIEEGIYSKKQYNSLIHHYDYYMNYLGEKMYYKFQKTVNNLLPKKHIIISESNFSYRFSNSVDVNKIYPEITYNRKFNFLNTYRLTAPFTCRGIQDISIEHKKDCITIIIDNELFADIYHKEKSYDYGTNKLVNLLKNEGFLSVTDFIMYYNRKFKGKIIHFTNLSY